MVIKYWFYAKANVYMDVDITQTPSSNLYEKVKKYLGECIEIKELDMFKKNKNLLILDIDGYFIDEEQDEEILKTISDVVETGLEEISTDVKAVSVRILESLKSSITDKKDE